MYNANDNGFAIDDARAIQWITLNAAKSLGIEDKTGSLEAGKSGDVVIWNQSPFSVYSKAEQVFIDGAKVYDRFDEAYQAQSDFLLGQE
jgi:imidazolonepropionase-like amidohydrolase